MNKLVIDEVDCDVCGSKKGFDCTREIDGELIMCGGRMDMFAAKGSYESRLKLFLEIREKVKERYKDTPLFLKEMLDNEWPLFDSEFEQWKAKGE